MKLYRMDLILFEILSTYKHKIVTFGSYLDTFRVTSYLAIKVQYTA